MGERIALYLANQSNELEAQIAACRERIIKTSEQIKEMVEFMKRGGRSESVGSNLRGLESYLRAETATLAKLLDRVEEPVASPPRRTSLG